ncbi:hypothetical protein DOTSEDRAFT_74792 [Dothistroma septosporum NZE10]|uniref:Uncharacterized protein n=1 Tax=Dothistroma septosporum (strain NZE10 / CBS 128990) TaxID=675120 RepID=N1PEK8_DOTSN|nr:hypothetical protein DOTSEDRAFT_74792 [Dothistroma septosporum NZE10]
MSKRAGHINSDSFNGSTARTCIQVSFPTPDLSTSSAAATRPTLSVQQTDLARPQSTVATVCIDEMHVRIPVATRLTALHIALRIAVSNQARVSMTMANETHDSRSQAIWQ